MKPIVSCLLVALLCGLNASAAQPATARMFSLSARFSKGAEPFGLYSLELTTIQSGDNGELAPSGETSEFDCWSWLTLYDETYATDPMYGMLDLNLPPFADVNGDGFHDFYDVSRACSGASSGEYSFQYYGSGNVAATWQRAAGSKTGTCTLQLQLEYPFTFTHTFEISDHRGTISYTPGASTVSGTLAVTKPGEPETFLGGWLTFAKDPANPTNWLTVASGSLTNLNSQALPFGQSDFDRDPTWPTNYYGYMHFTDGNLETSEADYAWSMLSIDDMNDTDHDRVPDFSDTPSERRAVLGLSNTGPGLAMTISADTGTTWRIEKSSSLTGGWSFVQSVTLTTDPQTIPLATPTLPTFWRAVKQ